MPLKQKSRERRRVIPTPKTDGEKCHYLYEFPKLHKAFSGLTIERKRAVLAAMDTSLGVQWIQTAIDEQMELQKGETKNGTN